MKQFSSKIMQIKNSENKFEPLATIKGESVYDIAVRTGVFDGTESEYARKILQDAESVGEEVIKLAETKANKTDVYTKEETIAEIKDRHEVGDVLFTTRDNLDSKWKRCDGSIIDASAYPELCSSQHIPYDPVNFGGRNIVYGNGVWAVLQSGGVKDGIKVSFTDDIAADSWTTITIYENDNYNVFPHDIAYYNGLWMVLYTTQYGYDNTTYAACTTNLSDTATWTTTKVCEIDGNVYDIIYENTVKSLTNDNGIWAAIITCSVKSNSKIYSYIITSQSPTAIWTTNQVISAGGTEFITMAVDSAAFSGGGLWRLIAKTDDVYSVYETQDPSGEWTLSYTFTSNVPSDLMCYNNTWAAVGYSEPSENGVYVNMSVCLGSISDWEERESIIPTPFTRIKFVNCTACDNKWYLFVVDGDDKPWVYTTDDAYAGTWVLYEVMLVSFETLSYARMVNCNNTFAVVTDALTHGVWLASRRALPNASNCGVPGYIKVRE